jgi:hypothetical protein
MQPLRVSLERFKWMVAVQWETSDKTFEVSYTSFHARNRSGPIAGRQYSFVFGGDHDEEA